MKYAILLTALFSFNIFAQSNGRVLKAATVRAGVQRYSVSIPKCGQTISHFRIAVKNGTIAVSRAGLRYANGQSNEYPYSGSFENGYVSSWIGFDNFRSATDCVTQLFMDAQAIDPRHPAQLILYGAFSR